MINKEEMKKSIAYKDFMGTFRFYAIVVGTPILIMTLMIIVNYIIDKDPRLLLGLWCLVGFIPYIIVTLSQLYFASQLVNESDSYNCYEVTIEDAPIEKRVNRMRFRVKIVLEDGTRENVTTNWCSKKLLFGSYDYDENDYIGKKFIIIYRKDKERASFIKQIN